MDEIAAQWPSDIGWRVELTGQCGLTVYNNFHFNTAQLNMIVHTSTYCISSWKS